jgi:hypothetical protein
MRIQLPANRSSALRIRHWAENDARLQESLVNKLA